MVETKYLLVIDNVPADMIERMKLAAQMHHLPLMDWLKLVIQAELDRCGAVCGHSEQNAYKEGEGSQR